MGYSTMVLTAIDRTLRKVTSSWWRGRSKKALVQRAAELAQKEPVKPWSEFNAFHFVNRFFGSARGGRLLGFRSRPIAMPGCHATPFQGHLMTTATRETTFAPTYHFVTDMGTDEAWTNLPGGPSENRFSQWYKVDIPRWIAGEYKRAHARRRGIEPASLASAATPNQAAPASHSPHVRTRTRSVRLSQAHRRGLRSHGSRSGRHALAERRRRALRRVESRETKVLNWNQPATLIHEARQFLTTGERGSPRGHENAEIAARVAEIASATLARGQNLHSPHYVGHQVPAPVPLAALFDFVGSVTNQVMAIYEMGPWATAVEHAVIDAVGERLGFQPDKFCGPDYVRRHIGQSDGLADRAKRRARRFVDRRACRSSARARIGRTCRRALLGHAVGRHSRAWAPIKSFRRRSMIAVAWIRTGSTTRLSELAIARRPDRRRFRRLVRDADRRV